jgi:hypothetical protein
MRVIDYIPLDEVESIESDEHSRENEEEVQLRILTKQEGKNRGRTYIYNLPHDEGMVWVRKLTHAVKQVRQAGMQCATPAPPPMLLPS